MGKMMPKGRRKAALAAAAVAGSVLLAAGGWYWYVAAPTARFHVTFYRGDRAVTAMTTARTVAGAVRDQGIRLKPQDVVVPGRSAPVTDGMEIDLGLVERQVKELRRRIRYSTHVRYTDDLNVGEIIDVEEGRDGLVDQKVESYSLNGEKAFEKVLESKVLTPVKDAEVLKGTALRHKLYPLRNRARVRKVITMEATAYYPGPEDTWPYASGTTASGLKAAYGVVAVDPRFIRLKTRLYVQGYGYAIAADTGGAIKGDKIDLCFDTYEEAVNFGRKKVKVYILR